jgi:Tol biopolymer transport system component
MTAREGGHIAVSRLLARSAVSVLVTLVLLGSLGGSVGASRLQGQPAPLSFETDRGQGNANVVVATAPGTAKPVTTAPAEDAQPAVSPEGRLAFASDRDGDYDIYVTARGTSGERIQVTTHPAPDYAPTWEPESGWLAFVSQRRGNADIYVIRASKSALAEQATTNRADDRDPAWSPRGIELAFSSNRAGSYDIWILGLGKKARRVTRGLVSDFEPAWSPDGTKLAFTRRRRDGNYDIYSLDLRGGTARRLTSDPAEDAEPTWSPDGEQIAFVSDRDGDYDIWLMNASGAGQVNFSNSPNALFDVSPSWKPPEKDGARSTQVAALTPAKLVARPAAATFTCEVTEPPFESTDRTDYICGTSGNDIINGGKGDDVIDGGGGNDTIYGSEGNDTIEGEEGRDRIFGGPGKDKVKARDGSRDRIFGGRGNDFARTDGKKLDKGHWERD